MVIPLIKLLERNTNVLDILISNYIAFQGELWLGWELMEAGEPGQHHKELQLNSCLSGVRC